MEDKQKPRGVHVYVKSNLKQSIDQYASERGLGFGPAVSEILENFFKTQKARPDDPATKKDIKLLHKKIELTNAMLRPALLELLEATAYSRNQKDLEEKKEATGREVRDHYADLFTDLREMI